MVPDRPQEYTTAGVLMLVSGITNVVFSMVWVLSCLMICVGVLWFIPMVVGVLEIITAVSMMNGKPRHNGQITAGIGLLAGIASLNVVSICCQAVALGLLSNPRVTGWLEQHDEGPPPGW